MQLTSVQVSFCVYLCVGWWKQKIFGEYVIDILINKVVKVCASNVYVCKRYQSYKAKNKSEGMFGTTV